jgi:hypothetical protein
MTNAGEKMQTYEDSEILNKDRKIDSFVEWIKLKTGENNIDKSSSYLVEKNHNKTKYGRKTKYGGKTRKKIGGKWSEKYKRSINCNKPKGFSQKQYCKSRRNK